MLLLCLETSSAIASVAIVESKDLKREISFECQSNLSVRLPSVIQELLAEGGVSFRDVTGIGVGLGPGSYTGVRIGVATAKALAQALKVPIVGVPTFDALARQVESPEGTSRSLTVAVRSRGAPRSRENAVADDCSRVSDHVFIEPGTVVCAIPARANEVFAAIYRCEDGHREKVSSERVWPVDALLDTLRNMKGSVLFVGTAAVHWKEAILEALGERVATPSFDVRHPLASQVAEESLSLFRAGDTDDLFALKPIYGRRTQAEEAEQRR